MAFCLTRIALHDTVGDKLLLLFFTNNQQPITNNQQPTTDN